MALAVVLVATAVLVGRAVLAERQTVDDVFIFLRTARNLAEHGEMVFDAGVVGGARVEGTSSPAWTMLLAVLWRCGARGLGVAKLASLALAAFVPLACGLVAARAVEGGRRKALALALAVPAVALAFDSDLATWASSGMDTALWTLACVACVGLAHRPRAAALALGGLAWIRPEAPLFAALGVVALAHDRRSLVRLAALAAVPIAVLLILRLGYFHALVPNTFWAKMNAADGKDYTGAGYLASALVRRPMLLLVLPAAALLPAPRSPQVRLAGALLVAALLFAAIAGGDWMPGRRLLVPALPLAAIVAAIVLSRRPVLLAAATSLALGVEGALTFDHAIDQDWRQHEWLDERVARWWPAARPFRDPTRLDWMPSYLLRQIAPYVQPGDTVAHVDVGELPYVMGDVAFLDGFGLVDRHAGRVAFSPRDPGLRAAAAAAFFEARPAVAIMVLDEATGRPFAPAQDAVVADPRFAGWRELARVPSWGGHPCVTFVRTDLSPVDRAVAAARVRTWLSRVPDVVPVAD